MVVYEDDCKVAVFNGLRFTRDDNTGYYLNSTIRKRLHRFVWESFNGNIQNDQHIHHKDGNKGNNEIENLCLLDKGKHLSLHGNQNAQNGEWLARARKNLDENVRPLASIWHGSDAGREWHRKQYESIKDKIHIKEIKICDNCGAKYETVANGVGRFCSNKCKSASRRKSGVDDETRICKYCEKEYTASKYSRVKHCSRECSCKKH